MMHLPIACLDQLCEAAATPQPQRLHPSIYILRAVEPSCAVAVASGIMSYAVGYCWCRIPESLLPTADCAFSRRMGNLFGAVRLVGTIMYAREVSVRLWTLNKIRLELAEEKSQTRQRR